jgi:hypothetical protein
MVFKYGVFQSTSKSCIFYKEDDDGNQSTFNIFVTPSDEKFANRKIFAYIDNEQMKKENWSIHKETNLHDLFEAFGGWASDAPLLFEIEAHKSISNCLSSILKKEED